MRHSHTSPFEMAELRFHLKIPIFIMRQHIRHRTANVNEQSGRYSVFADEFYVPSSERKLGQSTSNKQQSDGDISFEIYNQFDSDLKDIYAHANIVYQVALNNGVSREVARIALPVATYTELYWKIDLHNFFHYVKLRADVDHAQHEIVVLAKTMYEKVKKHFPISCQAFEDYKLNSMTFTSAELDVISQYILNSTIVPIQQMSASEQIEFQKKLEKLRTRYE
jgi:thymidylate synthase (FAD)